MTRLQLNRTAWASLALFFLFITPMTLNADEQGEQGPVVSPTQLAEPPSPPPTPTQLAKPPSPPPTPTQLVELQFAELQQEKKEDRLLKKELKLKQTHLSLIAMEIENYTDQARRKQDSLIQLTEHVSFCGGLSKKVKDELIGNATQSLHEARTNITVKKALIAHLEKMLKKAKPPQAQIESAHAKIQFLRKQYYLVQAKEKSIAALSKKAVVSRLEEIRIQVEREQFKAKLIAAESEIPMLAEIAKKPIADKIVALKTELVGLQVRDDITEKYLGTLSRNASLSMDIQLMQNEINVFQRQIQRWQEQLTDVQIEICRLKAYKILKN